MKLIFKNALIALLASMLILILGYKTIDLILIIPAKMKLVKITDSPDHLQYYSLSSGWGYGTTQINTTSYNDSGKYTNISFIKDNYYMSKLRSNEIQSKDYFKLLDMLKKGKILNLEQEKYTGIDSEVINRLTIRKDKSKISLELGKKTDNLEYWGFKLGSQNYTLLLNREDMDRLRKDVFSLISHSARFDAMEAIKNNFLWAVDCEPQMQLRKYYSSPDDETIKNITFSYNNDFIVSDIALENNIRAQFIGLSNYQFNRELYTSSLYVCIDKKTR